MHRVHACLLNLSLPSFLPLVLLLPGGGYQAHYRGDDAIINDVLIEEGFIPVPVPVPVPVVAEMQDALPVLGADQGVPIGAPWMGLYVTA